MVTNWVAVVIFELSVVRWMSCILDGKKAPEFQKLYGNAGKGVKPALPVPFPLGYHNIWSDDRSGLFRRRVRRAGAVQDEIDRAKPGESTLDEDQT